MSATPALHRHPAWFGVVMGTGAMASLISLQSEVLNQPVLEWVALGLLWSSSGIGLVLLPRYIARLSERRELRAEITDPSSGPMLATLPAGFLVLAIGWASIGPGPLSETTVAIVAAVLVGIGSVMAVAYSTLWALTMSTNNVGLDRLHGGWLLPVVISLLVPVALSYLTEYWPEYTSALLLVGFAFLGIGSVLFLGFFSLFLVRLFTVVPMANSLNPSLWIPLAPASISGVAAIELAQSAQADGIIGPDLVWLAVAFAAMGIGFGLWWALFASMEVARARASGGIPYSVGWWSYVFPTTALAISVTLVGQVVGLPPLIGLVPSAFALGVWLLVSVKTLRALTGGDGSHISHRIIAELHINQ